MYRCAKCGKSFEKLPEGLIRCPSCAFKIIFKERGPIVKRLQAR